MKLSNRLLGIFILLSIIGFFYILYQIFFRINLISIEINSNVKNFSGSLSNLKFSKNFFCKQKNCIIDNIPEFKYNIKIFKTGYNEYIENIDIKKEKKISINLSKKITISTVEKKKITREDLIEIVKNKELFSLNGEKIILNTIYNNKNIKYFSKNKKLYFIKNDNIVFSKDFNYKINYIKSINSKYFIINTDKGSFKFDYLGKKITYFTLFFDYISINNYYIGIINNEDSYRKKNFDLNDKYGNLLVSYNKNDKSIKILKTFSIKINKIYTYNNNIYIEDIKGNKYIVEGY